MITKVEIDGFKTFRKFSLEFAPFTVIAGTNASGKSNLFDALNLLNRLAEVDLRTAFSEQRGEAIELFTHYGHDEIAEEMSFGVEMLVDRTIRDNWGGETNLKYTRLRYELQLKREQNERGLDTLNVIHEHLATIKHQDDSWVKKHIPSEVIDYWRPKVPVGRRGKPYIYTKEVNGILTIRLPQDGKAGGKETPANVVSQTVLSGINSVDFPHVFAAKEEIRSWRFLQLNPEDLRKPSPYLESDMITPSGSNLAAALFRINQQDQYLLKLISRRLNRLVNNLEDISILDDTAGKQYVIKVKGSDQREFSSRVLSEGTLRILVLCVLLFDPKNRGLICFEEPENGVHPLGLKNMLELLIDLSVSFEETDSPLRQVIINTHSPVLLGEIWKKTSKENIVVWFSRLVTVVTPTEKSKKNQFQVTRMLQIDLSPRISIPVPSTESKIAMATALNYLRSLPTESTWLEVV